jgi:transcriptional regulator with XRE-family HTH domain
MLEKRTRGEAEALLGEQVRALRLQKNIDRATLAKRAGVSLRAVRNLEGGEGSTVRTLVSVVRALGRDEWLRTVAPAATVNPLMVPTHGPVHARQRARMRRGPAGAAS